MKLSETTSTAPHSHRLVCCAVQNEEFCFDLSDVRSITRANKIAPDTNQEETASDASRLGWIAAQKDLLPVYDLAHQLQLAPKPIPQTTFEGFVVALKTSPSYALRVDRITGNIDIPHSQMSRLPAITAAETGSCFKGIAQLEEKWLLCADAQRLQPNSATVLPAPEISEPATTIPARPIAKTAGKTPAPRIVIFLPAANSVAGTEEVPLVFGLSIMQMQEVTKLTNLLPVPQAPPYVLGITNWRNLPVPVIDLPLRLGLTVTPTDSQLMETQSRLLIASAPQRREFIGIRVKPQVKIFPLPIPYQPLQEPLAISSDLIKGVFDLEGMPFVIPDLDALLGKNFAPVNS